MDTFMDKKHSAIQGDRFQETIVIYQSSFHFFVFRLTVRMLLKTNGLHCINLHIILKPENPIY